MRRVTVIFGGMVLASVIMILFVPRQRENPIETPDQVQLKESVRLLQRVDETVSKLIYFRDEATEICYVYMYEERNLWQGKISNYTTGGPGLASIPCTPKVLKRIVNAAEQEPAQ